MLSIFDSWRKIFTISFGLVFTFFNIWVLFHLPEYVPEGQTSFWFRLMVSYLLLYLVVLFNKDISKYIFKIKFTEFLPRFLFFFVLFFTIFYLVFVRTDFYLSSIFTFMASVPLWLGVIHAFTFATIETLVWQCYLDGKIGQPWSALIAGIFHFGIWPGDAWMVILISAGVFFMFSLIHFYFKKKAGDIAPAAGSHFAYNMVMLGIAIQNGTGMFGL